MAGTKLYSHLAVMMKALNYIFLFFFFPPFDYYLGQKAKIGFHPTESNGSIFASSPGDVSTALTAQTDP